MKTAFNALLTLFALAFIWYSAEATNDRWFYVAFGVCLMLWPCQWSFRLGQKAGPATARKIKIAGVEFDEADLFVSLLANKPGRPGDEAAQAADKLHRTYVRNTD
jgi:hypothetical protein